MKVARWLLRGGWVAALSGATALAGHALWHPSAQSADEASYRAALRQLEGLDAALDRELLRSRAGLVMHYDALTRSTTELRQSASWLDRVPASLAFARVASLGDARARLRGLVSEKALLIERFKSENAVLRNSRQYYPTLLDELREQWAAAPRSDLLLQALAAVSRAVAHLDSAPAGDGAQRLSRALDELEAAGHREGLPPRSSLLDPALQHGRLIVAHSPVVDQLVSSLLALPLAREIRSANALYLALAQEAELSGQRHREGLAILSGLTVALALAEVITRLRAQARALGTATRELESINRELERERRREREQNELKTRFVSATSHEFRTPLSTILSSSQMLASYGERWDAERRLLHFERIAGAARHMWQLLEEILLIGRAEVGALVPVPARFDLQDFCQGLIDATTRVRRRQDPRSARSPASSAAPSSGTPPRIRLWFEGERSVFLDQRLLTHVLGNLLENALKYSAPDGEIGLRVHVGDERVEMVVQDAGIGIESVDLPQLFAPFQRGKNVGGISGSGLGLAAAKRALDVQGGSIDIRSELGKGTMVSVTLPFTRWAPDPGLEAAPPSDRSRLSLEGARSDLRASSQPAP